MLEGFYHLFAHRSVGAIITDAVDIIVVTYVVYRALLVLRGTRAMQMGTGIGVIFIVYVVSKWAGLITLFNLLNALLSSFILIVVVVFQNDIRRGLMRVGARAFFGGLSRQQESRVIDEVVAAGTELARHRIGALIAFEQDANLDEFVVGQGTVIDAAVQRELLVSLFLPDSLNKLHDGAVIIRNLRVAKAGVFFPMPDTKVLDKSLGSRHRAALGITEETDAVVVVVSEERGSISFCFNGNIVTNLDGTSLRQALLGLFGQRGRSRTRGGAQRRSGTVMQTSTGSYRIFRLVGPIRDCARGSLHRAPRAAAKRRRSRPRRGTRGQSASMGSGSRCLGRGRCPLPNQSRRPRPHQHPSRGHGSERSDRVDLGYQLRSLVVENLNLKILSFGFALVLYSMVHGSQDAQRSLLLSVVTLTPHDDNRVLMTPIPPQIHVTVRGPRQMLDDLRADDIGSVQIDLRNGKETRVTFLPSMVPVPPGVNVEQDRILRQSTSRGRTS